MGSNPTLSATINYSESIVYVARLFAVPVLYLKPRHVGGFSTRSPSSTSHP
jgi:hypothetical protein